MYKFEVISWNSLFCKRFVHHIPLNTWNNVGEHLMKVMSFKAILALGAIALTPFMVQAGTPNGHYSVELNKTEVVYLPTTAGAVVIGNPEIADVSIHSGNTIFVIGRGYGETNLIVLNSAGHKIMDADIQVVNNLPARGVRLYNGNQRETYNCAPYCQPAPVLGDNPEFIGANQGTATTISNNVATGTPTTLTGSGLSSAVSSFSGSNTASSSLSGSNTPTSFGSGTPPPQ